MDISICKIAVVSAVLSTKVVIQVRDIHIKAMEKALNAWVENNAQINVPLSFSEPLIRERQSTHSVIWLAWVVLQAQVMLL